MGYLEKPLRKYDENEIYDLMNNVWYAIEDAIDIVIAETKEDIEGYAPEDGVHGLAVSLDMAAGKLHRLEELHTRANELIADVVEEVRSL